MKNERWKTALGASLILHLLFLVTAIRVGSSQTITEPPKPIEVELGRPADSAPKLDASPNTAPRRREKPAAAIPEAAPRQVKEAAAAALPVPAAARETNLKPEPKADPVGVATTVTASRAPSASPGNEGASAAQPAPAVAVAGSQGGGAARSAAVSPASGFPSGNAARPGTNGAGMLPYVIKGPPPPYPREARSKGWTGKVRVRVLISEQGTVKDAVIALGSGYASLDEAARQALQRWLFSPAYQEGRAVAAWVVVPVRFKLE